MRFFLGIFFQNRLLHSASRFWSRAKRQCLVQCPSKCFPPTKRGDRLNLGRRSIFQFFLGKVVPTPLPSGIFGHKSLSCSALVVPSEKFCPGKSSLCRERLGETLLAGGTMNFCGPWDEIGFSCFFGDIVQPRLQFAKITLGPCLSEKPKLSNAAL